MYWVQICVISGQVDYLQRRRGVLAGVKENFRLASLQISDCEIRRQDSRIARPRPLLSTGGGCFYHLCRWVKNPVEDQTPGRAVVQGDRTNAFAPDILHHLFWSCRQWRQFSLGLVIGFLPFAAQ